MHLKFVLFLFLTGKRHKNISSTIVVLYYYFSITVVVFKVSLSFFIFIDKNIKMLVLLKQLFLSLL